jgi:hypothetical protein
MPKPMMRMAIVCLLAIFVAGGVHAASSHGSKGSRGGGHSVGGRSHRGSFHGGGGSRGMSSHGGGRSGGGRSHGGSSFRKGGGSHGMSSRGGGMFRGGNSHSGGGSSRHSVMGNRGGYFGGGSHGMTGMSRGGFSQGFGSRGYSNSGGNRWAGSGRPRGDRMSAGNFSGRSSWGPQRGPSRTSNGFSYSGNRFNGGRSGSAGNFGRGGTSGDRGSGRSSFNSNRTASRQFAWNRPANGSSRWAGNSGRRTSVGANRSFDPSGSFGGGRAFDGHRPPSSSSNFRSASGHGGFRARNAYRSGRTFGADRPTNRGGGKLGSLSGHGRGNSWGHASRFGGRHGHDWRSDFGGSGFGGREGFRNASFSRFGDRGFRGSRGYGYSHGGFRNGVWGYGGYRHNGYGFGGWGGDPWLSDLWILGDLFGLALDFGRFAIAPAWGFLAPSLLNVGLQAVNSFDSNDDSYGNSYDSLYGGYENAQYFDNAEDYAYSAPSYPALCGRYYSDENPGCRQEF